MTDASLKFTNVAAALLPVAGERLPAIFREIGRGEYLPDLDQRLISLAKDMTLALEQCSGLTQQRRNWLAQVPGDVKEARTLLAEKNDWRVAFAYQKAAGWINKAFEDAMRQEP